MLWNYLNIYVLDTIAKVPRVAEENDNDNDNDHHISKLRKSNIPLLSELDKKYTGRKVSRKNIEEENS